MRRIVPWLAAAALLAGCAKGGTEPSIFARGITSGGALRGTWVYARHDSASVPFLGNGGSVHADTLRFLAGDDGRWTVVSSLAMGPASNLTMPFTWQVFGDSVSIGFSCEPRELCDPLPPWVGAIGADGQLVISPVQQREYSRPYRKL